MTKELNLNEFSFDIDCYIQQDIKGLDFGSLTNGKLLRSHLLFLTGKMFDIKEESLLKLGRVVEMVHNATLTHDDVIDNSHTRRGAPSIPAQINNKKSVLLGDYMLARALHELSEFNNPKLTQELTLTLKDLVEGEWIQYENTNPYNITRTLYETLAVKKTGSLFRWTFIAPLLVKEYDQDLYQILAELGDKLGIIFQMTDDLIDFNPESKKSYGLDFRNNNINFVLQFIGTKHPELATGLLRKESIAELDEKEKAALIDAIQLSKEEVKKYLMRCKEIIKTLEVKHGRGNHASLKEFSTILDLIGHRVY